MGELGEEYTRCLCTICVTPCEFIFQNCINLVPELSRKCKESVKWGYLEISILVSFFHYYVFLGVYTFISSWCIDSFIIIKCSSLALVIFIVLMFVWYSYSHSSSSKVTTCMVYLFFILLFSTCLWIWM